MSQHESQQQSRREIKESEDDLQQIAYNARRADEARETSHQHAHVSHETHDEPRETNTQDSQNSQQSQQSTQSVQSTQSAQPQQTQPSQPSQQRQQSRQQQPPVRDPRLPKMFGAYVRPGIDDRPADWNSELSDADRSAVARLAVRQKPQMPPETSVLPEVQTAVLGSAPMSMSGSRADVPLPSLDSAFLDQRDPMVDSEGYEPTPREVSRLQIGFILDALLMTIPFAALNIVLIPWRISQMFTHEVVTPYLAITIGIGLVVAALTSLVASVFSDHTRSPIGRRTPWAIAGAIIAAIATASLASSYALPSLVISWAFAQIGFTILRVAMTTALAERMPDKFRPRTLSRRGIAQGLGLVLGVAASAVMLGNVQTVMRACAVFIIVATAIVLLVLPREHSSEYMRVVPVDGRDFTRVFRLHAHNARLSLGYIARLFVGAGFAAASVFTFYVVMYELGVSHPLPLHDAIYIVLAMACIMFIMSMLVSVVLTGVSDRWAVDRWSIIISCVVFAIAALIPWLEPTPFGLILFAALGGLSYTAFESLAQSVHLVVLPDAQYAGRFVAVLRMWHSLGMVLGLTLAAVITSMSGSYLSVFPLAAALVLIAAICMAFITKPMATKRTDD